MIIVNNTDKRYITLIKNNDDSKKYLIFIKHKNYWELSIHDECNNEINLNKINNDFFDSFILSLNTFLLSYKPKSLNIKFNMNNKIDFDLILKKIKSKVLKKYIWAASVINAAHIIFTFNACI